VTAETAPSGYDPSAYPAFAVTADVVVLTIRDRELQVLLVGRGGDPFKGAFALPGGFVLEDETLEEAAVRELEEETGISAADLPTGALVQLGAYGDPERDPRMRVVTVAYLAVVPSIGPARAGGDAAHAEVLPVRQVLGRRPQHELAFDHQTILTDAVEHARQELETTSIATAFVGPEFTLAELRAVYEAVWGDQLDPGNFRRKVLSLDGLVTPTGQRQASGPEGGKPAELFAAADGVRPLSERFRRAR